MNYNHQDPISYFSDEAEFRKECESLFWFSYRKNFRAIGGTDFTSDRGWGCMLRCIQMLYSNTLTRHHFNRGEWSKNYRCLTSRNMRKDNFQEWTYIFRWFFNIPLCSDWRWQDNTSSLYNSVSWTSTYWLLLWACILGGSAVTSPSLSNDLHTQILRDFLDDPNGLYSIQQIAKAGCSAGKDVGTW